MDTHPGSPGPDAPPAETPAARAARLRREAEIIAKARADVAAGRGVELDDVEAWFRALATDPSAPAPHVRRGGP